MELTKSFLRIFWLVNQQSDLKHMFPPSKVYEYLSIQSTWHCIVGEDIHDTKVWTHGSARILVTCISILTAFCQHSGSAFCYYIRSHGSNLGLIGFLKVVVYKVIFAYNALYGLQEFLFFLNFVFLYCCRRVGRSTSGGLRAGTLPGSGPGERRLLSPVIVACCHWQCEC